tara:strand:- start:25752 stop:26186 length:435 start_codon:yes stop_codon:yes gene_type:complete
LRENIQKDVFNSEVLRAEDAFIEHIKNKWSIRVEKLPIVYGFDYAVLKDSDLVGFIELKNRNFNTTDFPDSMINLNKWLKGKELRDGTGLLTLLACRYKDKDIYCSLTDKTERKVKWGARTKNTRDWQDIGPAVHIDIREFKNI